MNLLDPLARVIKIGIPYWMIGIVILSSILATISSKFHLQYEILLDFVANCLVLFVALFIGVIIYLQVRYQPYSFGELLPSSTLVALIMSAGFLIFQRSNESFGAGVVVLTLIASFVLFSPGIAAIAFGFPRILRIVISFLNHG